MNSKKISLSNIGWDSSVPPNGFVKRPQMDNDNNNIQGLETPDYAGIETTPEHYNLASGDPTCMGWERKPDDPNVVKLREKLLQNNGINDLEILDPSEVDRAATLLHRDGFVVIRDVLTPDQLTRMKAATDRAILELASADDHDFSAGGGAGGLPHRYSFGGGSASRHMLHVKEWCELIELETTRPILEAIFGSENYIVGGGGGDVALPGAIEYQGLHSDNVWTEPHDPTGRITMRELPVPVITINFPMIDLTTENGPIRQIPGTQHSRAPIPNLLNEPDWMKLSTLCPAPAGCAVIRDIRAWHGGTPNLSNDIRAMPNIEYFAPWFRSEVISRSMPYERWCELSPHSQRISRYVACGENETVIGAGYMNPRSKMREEFKEEQLKALSAEERQHYLARL
jgi:ectoine hydroxylase-related dioxygenase (phytanoyl-CoA dioxygenase family)